GAGGVSQLVEHRGVHVVADAEGEDAGVGRVLGDDVLDDLIRVAFIDGRLPVGEEDHVEGAARVFAAHLEGRVQRRLNCGAAAGAEVVDPLVRLLELIGGGIDEEVVEGAYRGGEADDGETVLL